MIKFITALIFTSLTLPVHAQLMSQGNPFKGLVLSCKHIYPIQKSYLNRHINYRKLTKNLEAKTVDKFIESLDPSKVYLLKSDVDKIKKDMKNIFAKLDRGECKAIEQARKTYEMRVKERVKFVKAHLSKGFKFDKKTELILDSDKRKFAKKLKDAEAYHKKYLQFQVGNYVSTDEPMKEAKEKVAKNYDRLLKKVNNFRKDDLWTSYLNAFSRSLDPHSSYFSKEMLEDFQISMSLSLEGIGATLSSKDGFTVIEQLVPGGAAFRSSKLKPKDKIIGVAQGKTGAFQNVIEMELRDVVRKIRGKKGTVVRLSVLRKAAKKNERFTVELIRDKINLEEDAASITYIDRNIGGKKVKGKMEGGKNYKVGLINLPSFYADGTKKGRSAAKDIKKLIKEAKKKKVSGLVLDLSQNGGGSLDDAVSIAGLFFKVGNVVKQSSRDPDQGEIELADDDKDVDWTGPLVVLTSKVSASASEIVSGTLKDYKRAIIVGGKKTFGKGTVQSVERLYPGLGALKTTVGMFYTAGGASTQHVGVSADIILPSNYDVAEIGEDTLDFSLPPKKIKPFLTQDAYVRSGKNKWNQVDQALISQLKTKSTKRVNTDKDFQKIIKELDKAKKKSKMIKVSELFEDKDKKEDDKKKDKDKNKKHDPELAKKEKHEKYMKRADIKESLNILFDFIVFENKKMKVSANNN